MKERQKRRKTRRIGQTQCILFIITTSTFLKLMLRVKKKGKKEKEETKKARSQKALDI